MSQFRCEVCKGEFDTNAPKDKAACPVCGEWLTEREVEYTDREGSFTIGGKVTQLSKV